MSLLYVGHDVFCLFETRAGEFDAMYTSIAVDYVYHCTVRCSPTHLHMQRQMRVRTMMTTAATEAPTATASTSPST